MLFRVDAGPEVGLGHLYRCLALAAELRGLGLDSIFLIHDGGSIPSDRSGFEFESLFVPSGSVEDREAVAEAARVRSIRTVVVDSYAVDAAYLRDLRDRGFVVVAIDDLAREPFPSQIVVNGCAHANRLPYCAALGDTRFLLGLSYALLREKFRDTPARHIRDRVARLMLTVGGGDPKNVTPKLLALLDSSIADCSIDVVIGPMFENRAVIQAEAARCRRPVRLLEGLDCLRDAMLAVDVVVSAGGQTLYELAATGTPAIALILHDNQASSTHALVEAGTAAFGGSVLDGTVWKDLPLALAALLDDREARERMSWAGRALVDGQGAGRVARAIEQIS